MFPPEIFLRVFLRFFAVSFFVSFFVVFVNLINTAHFFYIEGGGVGGGECVGPGEFR